MAAGGPGGSTRGARMKGGDVVVTRGWGDWRKLSVPLDVLARFHMTSDAGGTKARLPRPMLAAYMSCTAIPEGVEFGHSCLHGPPPHSIKVLVQQRDNDRALYQELRAQAE